MSMRFTEIGQQLRAYRLESGLRAEEIAARLGVSRAALYRYEKGEVIKLDTIKRLAELLKSRRYRYWGSGWSTTTGRSGISSGCGRSRKPRIRSCNWPGRFAI